MTKSQYRQNNLLNPERIQNARQTAGLTKVELARLLNVTTRTIENYEKFGTSLKNISLLAQTLDVAPSYFFIRPNDPKIEDLTEEQVWFRSLRRTTKKQRYSAIGYGRNALLLFRWISDHFFLPKNVLQPQERDWGVIDPEDYASFLRNDWGYGENPLPDMMALAESHGIRLFCLPSVGNEVDAFSFYFQSIPYIAINSQKSAERIRFDIAHEIGHLVMHDSLDNAVIGARDIEKEAQEFAANLLMPRHRVLSLLPENCSTANILEAKQYFRVSAMAMVYRVHELGKLSDWEYRQVCRDLTEAGYRSSELKGIKREESQIFSFVASNNRKKGISINTISEETGLAKDVLHAFSFGKFINVIEGKSQSTTKGHPNLKVITNPKLIK